MSVGDAIVWGFGATIVLSTMLRLGQALRITRVDLPFMLGSMFTADRNRAKLIGFAVHLMLGWGFALLYAAAFETADAASIWLGLLIGLVHGSFVVVVAMPQMPVVHPRMASDAWGPDPTRQLEPPGPFALNYGPSTPLLSLAAHLVFGAILGHFYSV